VRPSEPFSEQLQRVVKRHIAAEESSIARYRALIAGSPDPTVRMLLTELVMDEERHHGMLKRMESQLEAELGERAGATPKTEASAMEPGARRAHAVRRSVSSAIWRRTSGMAPSI
jgi:rubrerythrin